MKIFSFYNNQKRKAIQNSKFLKKGKYRLLYNSRTYSKVGGASKKEDFPKSKGFKSLIGKLFFGIRVKEDGKLFAGDAMYFSSVPNPAFKDIKIFNYEKQQVLTLCPNEKRYNLYMKNRALLQNTFPMPALIQSDDKSYFYIEKLIKQTSNLKKSIILHELFKFYSNYYDSCELKDIEISSEFFPDYNSKKVLNVKAILHHGDLSIDNFKIDENQKPVFFNFDHANIYPLYYDIFFFIFNQAIPNSSKSEIELLLNGEFNKYFPKDILSYLDAFIISFYNVRLKTIANKSQIDEYISLYKYLRNSLEGKLNGQ